MTAAARIEALRERARDRATHGSRTRYVLGCRCEPCTIANRVYARARYRAKSQGGWNGLVSAEPARKHLRALSRKGVGRHSVRAASDVSDAILWEIATGIRPRIRLRTEQRILAVDVDAVADHGFVDGRKTWRLIGRLLEEGFSKAELARRLGYKSPAIQFRKERVLAVTAFRVERFFRSVME